MRLVKVLNQIPDEKIRRKAIENAKKANILFDEVGNIMSLRLAILSLPWEESPEGHLYWATVYSNMENIVVHDVSQPVADVDDEQEETKPMTTKEFLEYLTGPTYTVSDIVQGLLRHKS